MNPNRWILLIVSVLLLTTAPLQAGVASLTQEEVQRLQALVQASPEGATWKKNILYQANGALRHDPNPIVQIQVEGQLEGSVVKKKSNDSLADMARLQYLGIAYALTGETVYFNKAVGFLTAWAKTCQPPEEPINATGLERLFETYDLLRPQMTEADRKTMDDWLRSVAQTLLSSDNPTKGVHRNNHQAHRLKTIAQIAFILNDQDLEQQTLASLKEFMEGDLNPDGTTLDFLQRDALHYHVYDLAPLTLAAILYQRAHLADLYNYKTSNGASVSQCVAFLLPYARGEKTHAEFVNTTVVFDVQRGNNGEATYKGGHLFDPKEAVPCLENSQYFQPELKNVLDLIEKKPNSNYPTLQCLLNEAMHQGPLPKGAEGNHYAENYRLAYEDFQQGLYAKAVSEFQQATAENPDSWQAFQGLGSALNKTGDQPGALLAYQQSQELNPNNPALNAAMASLVPPDKATRELETLSQEPFFDDFNAIDPQVWNTQNYTWPEDGSYQLPSQVAASNSILTIRVDRAPQPRQGRNILAGGLVTKRLFTYGKFSVKMKNQLVPGIDNCFFLMSPYQKSGWHHQELDFEFLGRDPRQVQVNVHKYIDHEGSVQNGGMLPEMIDLGFDSNQDFHVYAIEWLKDRIRFFVDGKSVWTETRNLPDRGLNVTVESFLVSQDTSWGPAWAGTFDPQTLPASAQFDWVKYEPAGSY